MRSSHPRLRSKGSRHGNPQRHLCSRHPGAVGHFPEFFRSAGEEIVPLPVGLDFFEHEARQRILFRWGQVAGLGDSLCKAASGIM